MGLPSAGLFRCFPNSSGRGLGPHSRNAGVKQVLQRPKKACSPNSRVGVWGGPCLLWILVGSSGKRAVLYVLHRETIPVPPLGPPPCQWCLEFCHMEALTSFPETLLNQEDSLCPALRPFLPGPSNGLLIASHCATRSRAQRTSAGAFLLLRSREGVRRDVSVQGAGKPDPKSLRALWGLISKSIFRGPVSGCRPPLQ